MTAKCADDDLQFIRTHSSTTTCNWLTILFRSLLVSVLPLPDGFLSHPSRHPMELDCNFSITGITDRLYQGLCMYMYS